MRLTFKNFSSGRNIKIFNTNAGIKVLNTHSIIHDADVTPPQYPIPRQFKYDFVYVPSLSGEDIIPILQMYNDNSFQIQSSCIKNNSQINPEFNEEYLQMESSGYISVTQYNDTILALTTNGDNVIQAKFIDNADLNVAYGSELTSGYWNDKKQLTDLPVHVGLYLPQPEFDTLLSSYNEDIMAPAYLLSGVHFNYLSEINASSDYAHINFDTAKLYANSLNMKNMYNENWDVSAEVTTSGELGSDRAILSAKLDNARIYTDINVSPNNTIWAKYVFGNYYSNDEIVEMQNRDLYDSVFKITRKYPISLIKPQVYPVYEVDNAAYLTSAHQYEHIERIKGFNKFAPAQLHKSNMFSIKINNSGFGADLGNNANIRNHINGVIYSMIEKLAPVHTQLFNIYWTDTTSAPTYSVIYNGNGADTLSSIPPRQNKAYGTDLTLVIEVAPTRAGYSFAGWYDNKDGTGTEYVDGDIYDIDESLILYAKWDLA